VGLQDPDIRQMHRMIGAPSIIPGNHLTFFRRGAGEKVY